LNEVFDSLGYDVEPTYLSAIGAEKIKLANVNVPLN